MPDRISVIIPVYNHRAALKKSLASLARQTVRPAEVIIVDDGSTDASTTGLERANFPWSPILIRQTNQGASAARNRGWRQARGDLVIFWDADTIARPSLLATLKKALDEQPACGYAYSKFKFGWKTIQSQLFSSDDLRRYNYIDTTALIKQSALVALVDCLKRGGGLASGPFDESLWRFQDWDLWLSLAEIGIIGTFVPEVLFKKIVGGREGISAWLPSFMHRLPWEPVRVREYRKAKKIIFTKHILD